MDGKRILEIIEKNWPRQLGKGDYYDPVFKLADALGILAMRAGAGVADLQRQYIAVSSPVGQMDVSITQFVGVEYHLYAGALDDIEYANDNCIGSPEEVSRFMAEVLVTMVYHDSRDKEREPYLPSVKKSGPLSVRFSSSSYDDSEEDLDPWSATPTAVNAPVTASNRPHPLAPSSPPIFPIPGRRRP